MKKVEAIQINEKELTFPTYYNCKKHNKVLNGICKDCEILICDDCVKEDHHIKEEFKKAESINLKKFLAYLKWNNEIKDDLNQSFPDLLKDDYTHDYYISFYKKFTGQCNLIRSLIKTYCLYKDIPQLMHNFYYIQFLHKFLNIEFKTITEDNINSFLTLFSLIDPFEDLILSSKNQPIKNKQGIQSQVWSKTGIMLVKYNDEIYFVYFDNIIVLKKNCNDDKEEDKTYFLHNGNIFIGKNLKEYTDKGSGRLIDTFGNYYNGEFNNQKKNGKGVFHIRNVYNLSCSWSNDLKDGIGECNFIGTYQTPYTTSVTFLEDTKIEHYQSLKKDDFILYEYDGYKKEAYLEEGQISKDFNEYQLVFDADTGISFKVKDEEILSNPELLTVKNNTVKYIFPDFSLETHALYDKESKKIIEHGTLLIDGELYKVEFIEDDNCKLCGRIEAINNKKIVSFIFYENGNIYVGDTLNNSIKDGAGMIQFPDGSTFIGAFKNDINNGRGIYNNKKSDSGLWVINKYIPDEEIIGTSINNNNPISEKEIELDEGKYVGELLDGIPNGKGTMYYKNGNIYRGLWKNGKKNGRGIYSKDNKIIHGVWDNDILNKNVVIKFTDSNDKYIGEISGGLFNGKGQYYFSNGYKYMGDFKEGLFHGKGTYYYEDEIVYNGDYLNNERTGKGVIYYSSSDIYERYEGYVINGEFEGKGKLYYKDGRIYEGDFKGGKYEGMGQLIMSDSKYTGEYIKGEATGYGVLEYNDGRKYIGQWLKDLQHGKGDLLTANGELEYHGEFVEGYKEGEGEEYEDARTYKGGFVEGRRDGDGILVTILSNYVHSRDYPIKIGMHLLDKKYNAEIYIGQFKNDKKEGRGVIYLKNYIVYAGEFIDDYKEGMGEERFDNGDRYLGYWKDGKFDGYGIMKYRKGDKFEGYWSNGIKQGRGVYFDKKGRSKVGIWEDTKFSEDNKSLYPDQTLWIFEDECFEEDLFEKIDIIKEEYYLELLEQ